jgi:hypothetical protein
MIVLYDYSKTNQGTTTYNTVGYKGRFFQVTVYVATFGMAVVTVIDDQNKVFIRTFVGKDLRHENSELSFRGKLQYRNSVIEQMFSDMVF